MTLDRAAKWTVILTLCLTIFGSGAGAAMAVGGRGTRLAAVEQKVRDYEPDHDTIIRLDANVAWIMRALGGTPK